VGPDGKPYDPVKKFGVLETENDLMYDNITTSFGLNLPANYYLKAIRASLPPAEKDDKWFIRPHHIETLTSHFKSIKSDHLNTRYYSHYNKDYGKDFTPSQSEKAMEDIERILEELKER
jgi:hypothetical protein